jgi:glycosyltransferase involved in cell wall biosynthesis
MRNVHIVHGAFIHTMFWEQLQSCPSGFRYDLESTGAEHELKADLRERPAAARWVQGARKLVGTTRTRAGLPNLRIVRTHADLVHSWQYPLVSSHPWVVDFEDVAALIGYAVPWALSRSLLRGLLGCSHCRALLPWTEASRRSVIAELGAELDAKTSVVLPAIAPRSERPSAERARRLLFVGSAFVSKGGIALLRAFARARNDFTDATLDVVSFVPEEYREEARHIPGVTIHTRLPPADLTSLFCSARALVAPFATDTFGFVVLEAFAHGTPAIVTRHFALPELVTDGSTGVVVATSASLFDAEGRRRFGPIFGSHDKTAGHPILDELREPREADIEALAEGMRTLLADGSRALEMGDAAFAETLSGRFSHDRRREALACVYRGALSR